MAPYKGPVHASRTRTSLLATRAGSVARTSFLPSAAQVGQAFLQFLPDAPRFTLLV